MSRHRPQSAQQISHLFARLSPRSLRGLSKTLFTSLVALMVEGLGYGLVLLLASGLFRLGFPGTVAFWLSVMLVLTGALLSLLIQWWGDVQFAAWLGRSLARHPQAWEEYQDWLHDILGDRQRMIDQGKPMIWVMLVTSWRLKRFYLTISLKRLWP